jgi:sorbitol-specific phosphotransferase system component IIA
MDIKTGVVAILNDKNKIIGTGFVAGENLILTCAHVVEQATAGLNERVIIRFSDNSKTEATVEQSSFSPSYEKDVALLRADSLPQGIVPLPLGNATGSAGHDFYAYGYAAVTDVQGIGARGKIVDIVDNGHLVQLTSQEPDHGMSGGPVLDEQRRVVIGMVTKGKGLLEKDQNLRNTQTTFATSVDIIREVCPELRLTEICPYRSLDVFNEDDASIFFGREKMVKKLLDSLKREPRFLAVLGPSGSGKSSVVRAGLIPALKNGKLPDSKKWEILISRPSNQPFNELDNAGLKGAESGLIASVEKWLKTHPEHSKLVLVIDQFEELLVNISNDVRQTFITELAGLLNSSVKVSVIVIMRDDFYSHFLKMAQPLVAWLERGTRNIDSTLTSNELREMILAPAHQVGIDFEEGLVDTILADATDADGNAQTAILPLLEFTLTKLWEERDDARMLHSIYHKLDRVSGGVSQWANETYEKLAQHQRLAAQQIISELVRVNSDDDTNTVKYTRRVRVIQNIIGDNEIKREVIRELVNARLLVTRHDESSGQDVVELIHEILISQWGELNQWLDENRRILTWTQQIEKRANLWIQSKGELLSGRELKEAQEYKAVNEKTRVFEMLVRVLPAGVGTKIWHIEFIHRFLSRVRKYCEDRVKSDLLLQEKYLGVTSSVVQHYVNASIKKWQRSILLYVLFSILFLFLGTGVFWVYDTNRRAGLARSLIDNAQTIYENDPWLSQRIAIEALSIVPKSDAGSYSTTLNATRTLLKWRLLGNNIDKIIPISETASIIDYGVGPGDFIGTLEGNLITVLNGEIDLAFANTSGEYFVVDYSGDLPGELRRTSDGAVIGHLSDGVYSYVTFSSDVQASYFATHGSKDKNPGELYRTMDGALIAKLTAPVTYNGISFSPDPASRYVLVKYEGDVPTELRRTSDGSKVDLSGVIKEVYFSPDPDVNYFVVAYTDTSLIEKRGIMDGKLLGTLESFSGFDITYSFDKNKTYYVSNYEDGSPSKLRRTVDGTLIATLSGKAKLVTFSSDSDATYVVVSYIDNTPAELRTSNNGKLIDIFPLGNALSVKTSQGSANTLIAISYSQTILPEIRQMGNGVPIQFDREVQDITINSEYAVLSFADGTQELLRLADGVITKFDRKVQDITINSEYAVLSFADGTLEFLRLADGTIKKFDGKVKKIEFDSNYSSEYAIIYFADNTPAELLHLVDDQVITIAGAVEKVSFSLPGCFIVNYTDGSPSRLLDRENGTLVTTFSGSFKASYYDSDSKADYAVITYKENVPSELRRISDGKLIAPLELSGDVSKVAFSKDAGSTYFVVAYTLSSAPDELRRTSDGKAISQLNSNNYYVTFSSDAQASYFVTYDLYATNPGELYRTANGALIAKLTAPVAYNGISFNIDPIGRYFLVGYKGDFPTELRRTSDGSKVDLSGVIKEVYFSPDPDVNYFVITYTDTSLIEKRGITDGKVLGTLASFSRFDVTYSSDKNKTYYVSNYEDGSPSKLRRTVGGTLIATLSGKAKLVTFSPDPDLTYVAISYVDDIPKELRRTENGEIVSLANDIESIIFTPNSVAPYFIVKYKNDILLEIRQIMNGTPVQFDSEVRDIKLNSEYYPEYAVLSFADGTLELLRLADGTIKKFEGKVKKIEFDSNYSSEYAVIYFADNTPAELLHLVDDQVINLAGAVEKVSFSLPGRFIVNYADGSPSRLFDRENGMLVTTFSGSFKASYYDLDSKVAYMVITYKEDAPSELRRISDGKLVAPLELPDDVSKVAFSKDAGSTYFVVVYTSSSAPNELRRTSDGKVISQLNSNNYYVTFSSDAQTSYFVTYDLYLKNFGELYRTMDGALIAKLTAPVAYNGISFNIDPIGRYFLVKYEGDFPTELRRTSDGSKVDLSGVIKEAYFSPELDVIYFVITYTDTSLIEKRGITDGKVLGTLESFGGFDAASIPDTGNPYYVKSFEGSDPSELRRTMDDTVIIKLPGKVASAKFSPDADATYVVLIYDENIPMELRKTKDGAIISLTEKAANIYFNSDPSAPYFWVTYQEKELTNLYNANDVHPVEFDNQLRGISFCPGQESECFLAMFHGDAPSELRRTVDNSLVAKLTGDGNYISYSPNPESAYFVVGYNSVLPGELRNMATGELVAKLSGFIDTTSFSDSGKYFVVNYAGDLSPEIRQTVDGKVIFNFARATDKLFWSQDPENSYVIVTYKDGETADLFSNIEQKRIATLSSGKVNSITFYPNDRASYFVATYLEAPTELHRALDGSGVQLSGEMDKAYFSPDPDTSYFVVTYKNDVPSEKRKIANGAVITSIPKLDNFYSSYFNVSYSPDAEKTFFVFTPDNAPSKLFRTKGNVFLETLSGRARSVAFFPTDQPEYLLIFYEDEQSELWVIGEKPYRAIQLANNWTDKLISYDRLVLRYQDGKAYIVFGDFLKALEMKFEDVPSDELIHITCKYLFASWKDDDKLESLLGRQPKACP